MSNAGVIRFPKIHNFLSFFENDTVLFVFFFLLFSLYQIVLETIICFPSIRNATCSSESNGQYFILQWQLICFSVVLKMVNTIQLLPTDYSIRFLKNWNYSRDFVEHNLELNLILLILFDSSKIIEGFLNFEIHREYLESNQKS